MPIEIEELVIRTKINNNCDSENSNAVTANDKYAIIQESVKEVLKILESKKLP